MSVNHGRLRKFKAQISATDDTLAVLIVGACIAVVAIYNSYPWRKGCSPRDVEAPCGRRLPHPKRDEDGLAHILSAIKTTLYTGCYKIIVYEAYQQVEDEIIRLT